MNQINNKNDTLFAKRYEIIPWPDDVDDDVDIGRSGVVFLAKDVKKNNEIVIIKRSQPGNPHFEEQQRNIKAEFSTLLTLDSRYIPQIKADNNKSVPKTPYSDAIIINYIPMEWVRGIRVESQLDKLTHLEKAEILYQFFELLDIAHSRGVANGDIDLKHLFWIPEQHRLVVIDWGNSKLGIDRLPRNSNEFSGDIFRATEIIHGLVAGKSTETGKIIFPPSAKFGSEPIPQLWIELADWYRRDEKIWKGGLAPCTARDLAEISGNLWIKSCQEADNVLNPIIYKWVTKTDKLEDLSYKKLKELYPRAIANAILKENLDRSFKSKSILNDQFRRACTNKDWGDAKSIIEQAILPAPQGINFPRNAAEVLLLIINSFHFDDFNKKKDSLAVQDAFPDSFSYIIDDQEFSRFFINSLAQQIGIPVAQNPSPLQLALENVKSRIKNSIDDLNNILKEGKLPIKILIRDTGIAKGQLIDFYDLIETWTKQEIDEKRAHNSLNLDDVLNDYIVLQKSLQKTQEISVFDLSDAINKALELLNKIIHALQKISNEFTDIKEFEIVWTIDFKCKLAFRKWHRLVSQDAGSSIYRTQPGIKRKADLEILEAMKRVQKAGNDADIETILSETINRLPSGWNLSLDIRRTIYSLDLLGRAYRLKPPLFNNLEQSHSKEIKELLLKQNSANQSLSQAILDIKHEEWEKAQLNFNSAREGFASKHWRNQDSNFNAVFKNIHSAYQTDSIDSLQQTINSVNAFAPNGIGIRPLILGILNKRIELIRQKSIERINETLEKDTEKIEESIGDSKQVDIPSTEKININKPRWKIQPNIFFLFLGAIIIILSLLVFIWLTQHNIVIQTTNPTSTLIATQVIPTNTTTPTSTLPATFTLTPTIEPINALITPPTAFPILENNGILLCKEAPISRSSKDTPFIFDYTEDPGNLIGVVKIITSSGIMDTVSEPNTNLFTIGMGESHPCILKLDANSSGIQRARLSLSKAQPPNQISSLFFRGQQIDPQNLNGGEFGLYFSAGTDIWHLSIRPSDETVIAVVKNEVSTSPALAKFSNGTYFDMQINFDTENILFFICTEQCNPINANNNKFIFSIPINREKLTDYGFYIKQSQTGIPKPASLSIYKLILSPIQ